MKAKLQNNSYFIYSITFLLLLPIIYLPFITEGRTFVWNVDGINQHYPILMYYGKLLRGILTGEGFPMIDFSVGLGFDTITTLHYYALGDPISLLTIFMTEDNGPIVYAALILLRLYLIGISFLCFCRYWGIKGNRAILGALMYVFCGYSFFSGVRHPYFLNPMIYLPLLLIGLEEVLRRRKPKLLVVMTFLCTFSNFYFLYLLTVMAVIYVLLRYVVTYYKEYKNKIMGLLQVGLRTGGYYLLGMAMAAVIFLPIIYAFLQNGRMDSKPELLSGYLHYNKAYYFYALQGIFASGISPHYWVDLSFSTVTGISVVILLCNKKYRKLAVTFLLSFLALCVPGFGYFMNAFTYITNRWDFLIAFIIAVVFTATYEKLYQLGTWERVLLGVGIAGYAVLCLAAPSALVVKLTFCLLCVTIGAVLLLQTRTFAAHKKLQEGAMYLLVVGTLSYNGYVFYAPQFNDYVKEFLTADRIQELTDGGEAILLSELEEGWYRVETSGDEMRNESLLHDFNDVSTYFSLMDGTVTDYYKQLELVSQRTAYRIDNQDARTIPAALAGVKYFISTDRHAAPFAYEYIKTLDYGSKTYYLLENLYALPLGYTYQSYMTEEDYRGLDVLQKQNALLYTAVLESDTEHVAKIGQDINIGIKELDYDIYVDGGIELTGDGFTVNSEGAVMTLDFVGTPRSETYIRFGNLAVNQRQMLMRTFKVKGEREITKNVNIRNKYHNSYFGKVNFLINTGYSKSKKKWARITFPEKGQYSCDQIEVYCLTMKHVKKQLQELRRNSLQQVKESNNRIEGKISLNDKAILVLAIPYSKGWSATVDGEKAELKKANIMYSAIELPEGDHQIVLTYRTPFLLEGILISMVSLLVFLGISVIRRRREASHD
jgi:uncharacterized membrane protein YfhO